MDFQLLLIYSRVNCCTARGLAVGVDAVGARQGMACKGCHGHHISQRPSGGSQARAGQLHHPAEGRDKGWVSAPPRRLCILQGARLHAGAATDSSLVQPLRLDPLQSFRSLHHWLWSLLPSLQCSWL